MYDHRLRIVLIAANIGRVGDAMRAVATGKALAQRGHHVTVLYTRADHNPSFRRYVENGVQIVESPRLYNMHPYSPFQNPWNILANLWWLMTHTYDVYHGFVPLENVGIPWMVVRRLRPNAVYVYDQSDLIVDGGFLGSMDDKRGLARLSYRLSAWTERAIKINADAHFVMSKELVQRAIEQGVQPDRVHLIRTGPMIYPLFPTVDVKTARARIGLDYPGLVLGYSAIHMAGLEELLAGLISLVEEGYRFKVIFTGRTSSRVEKCIKERGLEKYTILSGWLNDEDFWLHLSACDILLAPLEDSPMHRYNFPSKIVNYMAVGRPIVVGDVGDAGEFVKRHGIGIAYQGGALGLAQAIAFLGSNPDKRHAMGERARQIVAGEMSWNIIAARLEEVYASVLSTKRRTVTQLS